MGIQLMDPSVVQEMHQEIQGQQLRPPCKQEEKVIKVVKTLASPFAKCVSYLFSSTTPRNP